MASKEMTMGKSTNPSGEPRPIQLRHVPAPSNLAEHVMSRVRKLPVLIGGSNPSGNNGGGNAA